ncbi:HNH endonuclease [Clostridioides sp. GD02404]|uniref:HNH endonuclease n=1 Tax=Clostridioides sp. GD02404 TaxID=3054354 RepID=UPI00389ED6B7
MAFPKNVQVNALASCKRHCCLCEKYCKTNIELHHIIPKSKNGEDTIENCIPLCFDCHADVGSYNPKHPKGKNYSIEELKSRRDKFYEKIKNMPIGLSFLSVEDCIKLNEFKNDIAHIVEYIIYIDFSAEPFDLNLKSYLDDILCKWGKITNRMDNINLENIKFNILANIYKLNSYLTPKYFHSTPSKTLIFNNHPSENLQELQKETYSLRVSLDELLNKLYEYK